MSISSVTSNGTQQVVLTIGGITFTYFEAPQEINFGGKQALSIHKMIGGQRFIDAMGVDEDPITWNGRFRGSDATDRANALDSMRQAGLPVQMSWQNYKRLVLIREFEGKFQQFYEVPYKITVEVLKNQDSPTPTASQNISSALTSQLTSAQSQSDALGVSSISSAVGNISTLSSNYGSLGQVPTNLAQGAVSAAQTACDSVYAMQTTAISAGINATGNATQVAIANLGISGNYLDAFNVSNLSNTLDNMSSNIDIGD